MYIICKIKHIFGKSNVNESLLSQHPMGVLNMTGFDRVLYGDFWCGPNSVVQGQSQLFLEGNWLEREGEFFKGGGCIFLHKK